MKVCHWKRHRGKKGGELRDWIYVGWAGRCCTQPKSQRWLWDARLRDVCYIPTVWKQLFKLHPRPLVLLFTHGKKLVRKWQLISHWSSSVINCSFTAESKLQPRVCRPNLASTTSISSILKGHYQHEYAKYPPLVAGNCFLNRPEDAGIAGEGKKRNGTLQSVPNPFLSLPSTLCLSSHTIFLVNCLSF